MLKTVDKIKAQITPNLQSLLNDVLSEGNDPRPLMFGDEQEFQTIKGIPFPAETNACFNPFLDRFIIFLKRIDKIGLKEEQDIAHELGHLWLLFLGLPSEKRSDDGDRQACWDTFFSPLRDIMEHAVYYPLMEGKYQINLYTIGNERLVSFITDQLPTIGNESVSEKLLLILNYIKYKVESDDHHWLKRLYEAYSKQAIDARHIADSLLPLVQELAGAKDSHLFISQYRKVLETLGTHFDIPVELWPAFLTGKT
ncbi:MAG: hypothetical protein L6406_19720 [Desulfobacterales bacterium]|nr:hypothetical protein [Desulfobacterales bacterium]